MENADRFGQIVRDAVEKNASDIHCTPGCPMMYRIDGGLSKVSDEIMEPTEIEEIFSPILSEQQKVELKEKGEFCFAYSITGVARIRINIYRQRGTYAMSIRILPSKIYAPDELGIPNAVVELTQKRKGLILITGAAGSGKSTTLASLIQTLAKKEAKNIITIEDPIEHLFCQSSSMISQREIGNDTGSYSEGLKSALRQDPDVIMIGEMHDVETIELALVAAETGRLVLSTLHTDHAVAAIERMVELFPAYKQQQIRVQISNVLLGITVQQLLPKLDEDGRVAVYEVMRSNKEMQELIQKGKTQQIVPLMQNAKKEGMQTMDDAIYSLYMQSLISAETAIRYAEDASDMQKKVILF